MKLFLVSSQSFPVIKDLKAAIDIIKEHGGIVKGLAPSNMGFIVEVLPDVAEKLNLIEWA